MDNLAFWFNRLENFPTFSIIPVVCVVTFYFVFSGLNRGFATAPISYFSSNEIIQNLKLGLIVTNHH